MFKKIVKHSVLVMVIAGVLSTTTFAQESDLTYDEAIDEIPNLEVDEMDEDVHEAILPYSGWDADQEDRDKTIEDLEPYKTDNVTAAGLYVGAITASAQTNNRDPQATVDEIDTIYDELGDQPYMGGRYTHTVKAATNEDASDELRREVLNEAIDAKAVHPGKGMDLALKIGDDDLTQDTLETIFMQSPHRADTIKPQLEEYVSRIDGLNPFSDNATITNQRAKDVLEYVRSKSYTHYNELEEGEEDYEGDLEKAIGFLDTQLERLND